MNYVTSKDKRYEFYHIKQDIPINQQMWAYRYFKDERIKPFKVTVIAVDDMKYLSTGDNLERLSSTFPSNNPYLSNYGITDTYEEAVIAYNADIDNVIEALEAEIEDRKKDYVKCIDNTQK